MLTGFLFLYNCSNPGDNKDSGLSESEEMTLVAAVVSTDDGGAMADVEMASDIAAGTTTTQPVAPGMQADGLDTTLTNGWITYNLNVAFYAENGTEMPSFITGVTDKIVYNGSLSGSNQKKIQSLDITLSSHSSLTGTGIKSGQLILNGEGSNTSGYTISGPRRTLTIQAASSYKLEDVSVDLNNPQSVPASGTLTGTVAGNYTLDTGSDTQNDSYSFTFTITFTGDSTVKVTLPSGDQYSLDLSDGTYTKL